MLKVRYLNIRVLISHFRVQITIYHHFDVVLRDEVRINGSLLKYVIKALSTVNTRNTPFNGGGA